MRRLSHHPWRAARANETGSGRGGALGGGLPQAAAAYDALAARAGELPDHACLVRLAWGSGRDATTVAYGLRGGRSPTSRRLTADGFPLGWAELAIFDAAGRRVRVLASGVHKAGEHRISWDGANEAGQPVAPGVYFARIHAGSIEASRRLVRIQ